MIYDNTAIASRYNSARGLPEATMKLWLKAVCSRVDKEQVTIALDVGCGTGRFTAGLATALNARVIGIDPALKMLHQAKENIINESVSFLHGSAESLPVNDESVNLIFISMVYHHIENPGRAAEEFNRVLCPGGFVCIRNSTRDLLDTIPYLQYFPEAMTINRNRLPSQRDVVTIAKNAGLVLMSHEVVEQIFADTLSEYCEKISHRGLSDLTMLSDFEFDAGVLRMNRAAEKLGDSGPIPEHVDLFVFKKESK